MSNLLLIDDGYTCDACISQVDGIHGTLEFTYRPMTHEERDQVARALAAQNNAKSATEILAKVIAEHVTGWNIPADISIANVKRIVPNLFDKLYSVVAGSRPSDPLPASGDKPEGYDEGKDLKNS